MSPPAKKTLSIVSWNVQTFFETKAQANPYVNVVINGVLEDLDADVCLLLETRENVSVNLSAIEHRLANPTSYKPDESTEDEWDTKELEEEAAEALKQAPVLSVQPLKYMAIGTELTGKRFKPPERIFLYDNDNKNKIWPKFHKAQSLTGNTYNQLWKTTYSSSGVLQAYYTPFSASSNSVINIWNVGANATAESDVEFRLNRCTDCGDHLGKNAACDTCAGFNPFSTALENLRNELDSVSYRAMGNVELETYGILVRPHNLFFNYGRLIQLKDKAASADHWGCQILRYAPPPPNAKLSLQERAQIFKRWARLPSKASDTDVAKALQAKLVNQGIDPDTTALAGKLDALGVPRQTSQPMSEELSLEQRVGLLGLPSNATPQEVIGAVDKALQQQRSDPVAIAWDAQFTALGIPTEPAVGDLLPYLDPSSTTFGRSPFVVPMVARLSGDTGETAFPVVGFHAPYGADNGPGLQVRVDALAQLLQADVGSKDRRAFRDHDPAIIIGDLNLDLAESTTNMFGKAAHDAYQALASSGFDYLIPKVPSSLISVFNNNWKKQKKSNKYEGAPFLSKTGDVTNFTSSAYDNILVRGTALKKKVITAAVVDVLGWIKDKLQKGLLDPTAAIQEWSDFTKLDDDQKAFFIYRVFVSDHLPVVLDLEVDPLPDNFDEQAKARLWINRIAYAKSKIRRFEVSYTKALWLDLCPATTLYSVTGPVSTLYIATLTALTDSGFALSDGANTQTFGRPAHLYGVPELNKPAAVLIADPGTNKQYVHALIGCGNPTELFVPVDRVANCAITIGRVTAVAKDRKRFRIAMGEYRCTLPVPESWPDAPAKDSYVLVVLEGCNVQPVQTAV
jgi:hypothetical protein